MLLEITWSNGMLWRLEPFAPICYLYLCILGLGEWYPLVFLMPYLFFSLTFYNNTIL